MSSTNKTPNLRLNSWIGSDIPCREDFVSDNLLIDSALGSHISDTDSHITSAERGTWNSPYSIGTYMGNGASSRVISFGTDFTPKWGLVFSVGTFPSVNDYVNKADYNYFAVLSQRGSTAGITLSNGNMTVTQSTVAVASSEYKSFNENGVTYVYIVFR